MFVPQHCLRLFVAPQSVECQLLWQCTGSVVEVVATRAAAVFVTMVEEGRAEFSYVLNSFLNQIPTAK